MPPAPRTRAAMSPPDRPDDRMADRSPGPLAESVFLMPRSANVAAARRFVTDWFCRAAGLDPAGDVCADLALITSELVTNAFEHGDDEPVEVRVVFEGSMCVLSVTSHGDAALAPSGEWRIAGARSATGRGLGIVKSLVDSIDVRRDGDRLTVTVARRQR
jgi:anti-sigma regulatory factor (Ser/Thr protein kinase)